MASFGLDTVRDKVDLARAEYVDNTDWIRNACNAGRIRDDVNTIVDTIVRIAAHCKNAGISDQQQQVVAALTDADRDVAFTECKETAKFLFDEMPVVFMRLFNNQLNIPVFFQMLDVLESVERGERDQNGASVVVGKLLHRIFIGGQGVGDQDQDEGGGGGGAEKNLDAAKPKLLTWAEHCATRNRTVMHEVHTTQRFKDDSKAKLQAAIHTKHQGRTGGGGGGNKKRK